MASGGPESARVGIFFIGKFIALWSIGRFFASSGLEADFMMSRNLLKVRIM